MKDTKPKTVTEFRLARAGKVTLIQEDLDQLKANLKLDGGLLKVAAGELYRVAWLSNELEALSDRPPSWESLARGLDLQATLDFLQPFVASTTDEWAAFYATLPKYKLTLHDDKRDT